MSFELKDITAAILDDLHAKYGGIKDHVEYQRRLHEASCIFKALNHSDGAEAAKQMVLASLRHGEVNQNEAMNVLIHYGMKRGWLLYHDRVVQQKEIDDLERMVLLHAPTERESGAGSPAEDNGVSHSETPGR